MTRRSYSIGLFACLLSAGCDTPATPQHEGQETPRMTQRAIPTSLGPLRPWDAHACGDDEYRNDRMERHPDLTGRSAEDLLDAYGRPRTDERFVVVAGSEKGAYRGGVASQLPGGARKNARTTVREIVWQRSGCDFIVRFREIGGAWRVFDAFEAGAGADF